MIAANSLCYNQVRRISQAAFEKLRHIPSERLVWKANENDPRKHNKSHEGLFYDLPLDEKENFAIWGDKSPYDLKVRRFYSILGQQPLMIRQHALQAMDYLRKVDYSKPNLRILFYGDKGHGKTHTLAHLLHYLHLNQDHFIIHIREMKRFARGLIEPVASTSRPGRIDTPLSSAMVLQQFKMQNANLLEKYNDTLLCTRDYKWSLRELTKAGEPLINVADHGINRVIHASDCLAVLFRELTSAADEGKIKLASVLDNVQFLFQEQAGTLKHPDHKKLLVDEITVARAIKKLIKGAHKGGVTLATCDDKLSTKQNQTPREVLGLDGWNHFDPCLPVHVPKYSRKEYESCMNFLQDVGWLCRPESKTEEVRDEIRFISGLNPGEVVLLCKPL